MLVFMSRYGTLLLLLSMLLIVLAIIGLRPAGSFTNEFRYGKCITNLTCANCVLHWAPDNQCASGKACVAFWRKDAGPFWFKACVPTGDGDDWCNTGSMPAPAVICSNAFYTKCACREITTGDCPSNVVCECDPNNITNTHNFVIDKACY
jgi:hypothetical protein